MEWKSFRALKGRHGIARGASPWNPGGGSRDGRVDEKPTTQRYGSNPCPLPPCELKVGLAAGRRFGTERTDLNPTGPL